MHIHFLKVVSESYVKKRTMCQPENKWVEIYVKQEISMCWNIGSSYFGYRPLRWRNYPFQTWCMNNWCITALSNIISLMFLISLTPGAWWRKYYKRTKGAYMKNLNYRVYRKVSLRKCAKACRRIGRCRSFEYNQKRRRWVEALLFFTYYEYWLIDPYKIVNDLFLIDGSCCFIKGM